MVRAALIWTGLGIAVGLPFLLSLHSPLLAWRSSIYIAGGAAGVLGFGLLLVQPVLALGLLPGITARGWRQVHLWTGATVVLAVIVHVGALWVTSPPDVIDALTFTSPTPFAAWGVVAMWAIFATAAVAALRRGKRLRWRTWRGLHLSFAVVIVTGTIVHAVQIEGTMEPVSKLFLSTLVGGATLAVLVTRRIGRSA